MMKKQIIYWMFATAAICAACGEEDEINQVAVVENPVTGITVQNEYITEEGDLVIDEVGAVTTLNVSVLPENAGNVGEYSFRFGSSNADVFTVSREGVITTVASGEAELTITLVDEMNVARFQLKYRVAVDYRVKVEEILVADGEGVLNLKVGDTYDLAATLVVLPENAENPSVSYILKEGTEIISLENGVVEVLNPGTAVIEVKANDESGVATELRIEVKDTPDTDIYFEPAVAGWMISQNMVILALPAGNNAFNIAIDRDTLLPGEYSGTDIRTVAFPIVDGITKNSTIDRQNPGSFTIQYDEATQKYTIKGVLNVAATATSPALTFGFYYVGELLRV